MIPQLLAVNFGDGPSCELVTTGFDPQDLETGRAIVQAFAQNDPSKLKDIDSRRLLDRLGIPLLDPVDVPDDAPAVPPPPDVVKASEDQDPPAAPYDREADEDGVAIEDGRYVAGTATRVLNKLWKPRRS